MPATPERELPLQLIDIGVNLTHGSFHRDRDQVIARALGAGVARMIVTGTTEQESRAARDLAASYPGTLFATAGVHPHDARHWTTQTADVLEELARAHEVVAMGETGLDFNRNFSSQPDQERAFAAQLDLAAALGMPVFIHERDAHRRLVEILEPRRHLLGPGVVHCFTGTHEELAAYLALDLHIGITGWICDERRGLHLRELVRAIPSERLLVETDAPFLLPRDLQPRPKDRRNEPAFLPHVVRTLARCLETPLETVAATTAQNARRFFRLDPI
jgi:TatD DNase family protein